jgi:hypothetical protein
VVVFAFLKMKTNCYWTGGMAQVAEYLPPKCKTLSSNPRTTKKKKGEERTTSHLLVHSFFSSRNVPSLPQGYAT